MRIAIASGKGGTGKTTIAVNLLLAVAELPPDVRPAHITFLDCDVEEPNANLFLNATLNHEENVGVLIPQIDQEKCTHCGTCAEVCAYHAIAAIGQQILVFPQLCHGCGSCSYNCPANAIDEVLKPTGTLAWGTLPLGDTTVHFGQGEMHVGEAMASPIIRALKNQVTEKAANDLVLLDAPPGNACPVVETMRGADYILLVTEPTPFGLHDLRVAVQVAQQELHIPAGVVINRVDPHIDDQGVEEFCKEHHIPILMRLPLDRAIAEAYAEGIPLVHAMPAYKTKFAALYNEIVKISRGHTL